MSFNPNVNRQVDPSGRVPVGTGQQVPTRNAGQGRRVVNPGQHGPQVVVVKPAGQQIPPAAAAQMRGRAHQVPAQPAVVVVQQSQQGSVMRQVPGTNLGLVTKK